MLILINEIKKETLIVWTEPNQTDYAISFQEQAGCNDIWFRFLSLPLFFLFFSFYSNFDFF